MTTCKLYTDPRL